mmetsp:Transcript_14162/g.40108  ORF Transcript_14162/g.40108 Transcript_14162/m.40108 type:complete len:238 (-) Transcript_14162:352-1065(-)
MDRGGRRAPPPADIAPTPDSPCAERGRSTAWKEEGDSSSHHLHHHHHHLHHPVDDDDDGGGCIGAVPGQDLLDKGEPRVEADHPGVRVLRRVPEEVRDAERVAVLRGGLRLPFVGRFGGRRGARGTRGPLPEHLYDRPGEEHRQEAGGAARGAHVRFALVGPGGDVGVGLEPEGSRVPLRRRHLQALQLHKRPRLHREGPPAGDGGVQVDVRQPARHGLERPELLLQVWKPGRNLRD